MLGINREIAEHNILMYPRVTLIKKKQRRLRLEWALLIKKEVEKQLKKSS